MNKALHPIEAKLLNAEIQQAIKPFVKLKTDIYANASNLSFLFDDNGNVENVQLTFTPEQKQRLAEIAAAIETTTQMIIARRSN